MSGPVRIARMQRPRETTYLPGTILAVDLCGPLAADEPLGIRGWSVNVLTVHGWDQVASWPTAEDEAKARRLVWSILQTIDDPDPASAQYVELIEPLP